jgi:hypothetical protein
MQNVICIGVDPAFRKGGFHACLIDYTDRTVRFMEFENVLRWHDWLRSDDAPDKSINRVCVVVENSNMQNMNFDQTGNRHELQRKGRNVGTNQAVSQLAYWSVLEHYGPNSAVQVSPREKGAKWDEKTYRAAVASERLTTETKSNNQDQRDAFKLALIAKQKLQWTTITNRPNKSR